VADARRDDAPIAAAWRRLWDAVQRLAAAAARLRHLSQREPLAQRRPGYPHPGLSRPHDLEVREVLEAIQRGLVETRDLIPSVLPEDRLPGMAPDEQRDALAGRAAALERLTATLTTEAFQPLPPLPKHAPPYLVEPPGHDLPGTKAVLIAAGLESLTTSLSNLLLAAANTPPTDRPAG
jgi:hypothetical protein